MRSADDAGIRLNATWPDRLIRPRNCEVLRLGLRNLYILPSRFGWLWLASSATLYLMGTGSNSSGPVLLAYGGLGLFIICLFLTQFNLQGLTLQCGLPKPGFAAAQVLYPVETASQSHRLRLYAYFQGETSCWSGDIPEGRYSLSVPWTPQERGLQRPGRLKLETRTPLGLFICWTLWEPSTTQLIYPIPERGHMKWATRLSNRSHEQGEAEKSGGDQTWTDLGPHRPEEGMNRVAWKQLARSGQYLSKEFSDPEPKGVWLTPDRNLPWEQALSRLCDQCIRLTAIGTPFGMIVMSTHIRTASGARHLQHCLETLALAPSQLRTNDHK